MSKVTPALSSIPSPSSERRTRGERAIGWLFAVGFSALVTACIAAADKAQTDTACPSAVDFPVVSQLLERRCGTLDCHGQPGRSLRIYGRYGLRRPTKTPQDGYVSGGLAPTTAEEMNANLFSTCGVEPEKMAAVVAGSAKVDTLTVVRKPRLTEAHKGGRVFAAGTDGDKCFTSWIDGQVDLEACNRELVKP